MRAARAGRFADRHHAHHLPCRDVALRQRRGIERRAGDGDSGPQRAEVEGVDGLRPADMATEGRLRAGGVDREVERAMTPAGGVDQDGTAVRGPVDVPRCLSGS